MEAKTFPIQVGNKEYQCVGIGEEPLEQNVYLVTREIGTLPLDWFDEPGDAILIKVQTPGGENYLWRGVKLTRICDLSEKTYGYRDTLVSRFGQIYDPKRKIELVEANLTVRQTNKKTLDDLFSMHHSEKGVIDLRE